MDNAAPTSTCFGLVPEGSDELAKDYMNFFKETVQILTTLHQDLSGAGNGLIASDLTYQSADGTGPS